jgi:hypothetical protein
VTNMHPNDDSHFLVDAVQLEHHLSPNFNPPARPCLHSGASILYWLDKARVIIWCSQAVHPLRHRPLLQYI